mgnify:CR=1 FL=1
MLQLTRAAVVLGALKPHLGLPPAMESQRLETEAKHQNPKT